MPNELILKKLEQIKKLLGELESLLSEPIDNFEKNTVSIRASERNFQLIVDLASDINTQILLEKGEKTPDTYRQSFTALGSAGVIDSELARELSLSASLRNILVHEYDFEEDFKKFYESAKSFIEPYKTYLKKVYDYAIK
ncbi:MAG: DUF86 domain-containing protein [Candidatus Liptonbacteria bacterium]|nr:DUF86 domain-containing protein [Candidatus Liptonbacteria bacterium]